MTNRVYGIDLGTTYSCIAYVDEHGKPVVVPNAEGQATTPSVVYFESPDNVAVGNTAKEYAVIHKDRVVSTIKRRMGHANFQFEVDGKNYSPQGISSFILRKLVNDAAVNTGEKIIDVVITCPAYFGTAEREATKQAGTIAGLNVLYVIPEPTAAAIAYGMSQTTDQTVLVYDLGGGTFDVTIIRITAGEIAVVATGGDDQLGGKDWDDDIVAWAASKFEAETGVSGEQLLDDMEAYQDLLNQAEVAKVKLSSVKSAFLKVSFETHAARLELTREKFDELTRPRLERTISLLKEMIETGKTKGITKIDKLLLIGGSTYMPQVIERMKEFGIEVQQFDPNQAVAKGAALMGQMENVEGALKEWIAQKTGQDAGDVDITKVDAETRAAAERQVAAELGLAIGGMTVKKVRNVSSKALGVIVHTPEGKRVSNLVLMHDRVPCEVSGRFSTLEDGQTDVKFEVMQSQQTKKLIELALCVPETPLGEAVLTFEKPLPKSSPLEVTFKLGPDGRLTLHGRDLTTQREIEAEFQTELIMSEAEVNAARSAALALNVT